MSARTARTLTALTVVATLILGLSVHAPSAEAAVSGVDSEEQAAILWLNQERAALGLGALHVSPTLTAAAVWMADDLATLNLLSHTDSLGRDIRARFTAFGYPTNSAIRENVAAGYTTGQAVMGSWMDSPGHRANNLATDVTALGIARVNSDASHFGWFWVLTFGSVRDTGTVPVSAVTGTTPTPTPSPSTPVLPAGTPGAGTFAGEFPQQGVGLLVWNGGNLQQLVTATGAGGAGSVWAGAGGRLVGYTIGAPSFVNASFIGVFPDGNVAKDTALLVVAQ
ncbi:MAG: CAP domain-containing protein [Dehalococcoidia bacterium]|nr:CAP domain-containing protein [Dehalococcoidia bacterium]